MMVLIIYAAFCVVFALYNKVRIEQGRRIYHGINGSIHLLTAIVLTIFVNWQTGVALLFVARLFFDVALNLFRGLPFDYIPEDPKSIVDRLEKKVFPKDGITPKLIYILIIFILLNIP